MENCAPSLQRPIDHLPVTSLILGFTNNQFHMTCQGCSQDFQQTKIWLITGGSFRSH